METIQNELLTVEVSALGAELQSIKDSNGREYLWQAGEKWPRRSPILFPIVCSVNNDTYRVEGKEYHLPRSAGCHRRDLCLRQREVPQEPDLAGYPAQP